MPKELLVKSASPTYGRFSAQPFERGFASTVGNVLRRCLMSSIDGAAVTAVHIEGVIHEFSALPGVVEDVTDILLNLRLIPIRLDSEESKYLSLDVTGPGLVKAGELAGDSAIEIVDPEMPIATLHEEGHLKMQVQVRRGRGYVTAQKNTDETMGIGWIPVDSVHSPVRRVSYRAEPFRVGHETDFERLILDIRTNGTVTPERALALAAMLLRDHLGIFTRAEESMRENSPSRDDEELSVLDKMLAKSIDELDLSVRTANCLKNANIHTLRDLVRRQEREMLETKNLGKKSLEELEEVLRELRLSFGMHVPEHAPAGADV